MLRLFRYLIACMGLVGVLATSADDTEILEVMHDELMRNFDYLKSRDYESEQSQEVPPYYISYEITREESISIRASYGEKTGSNQSDNGIISVDLRVGDFQLDNTHPTGGFGFGFGGSPPSAPVDDNEALRTALWLQTDKAYKQAIIDFSKVLTTVQTQVEKEDKSGDFSQAAVEQYTTPTIELVADRELFEEKIALYTEQFSYADHITANDGSIGARIESRWFVNSEGTRIKVSEAYFRIVISASTKADDGMVLRKSLTYEGDSQEALLAHDPTILQDVQKLIADLKALQAAPMADAYTGPAILSGRASGVFFHEILGHRLEGHRQKQDDESQTFADKIGEYVLPETFSVIFDPTVRYFGDQQLVGDYEYDNEGVKARRVVIVEKGILQNFLMSRAPIEGFPVSNGHGRKQTGSPIVVARQSNMFIEVENPVSPEELEAMMIARLQEQGKEYGIIFDDISGGFTFTGRAMPNAFNVSPVLAYKLYADGTREVIRGGNMIGTPLTTFSRVEQGSTEIGIFNGMCGAESGWVPVSTVAPAILVSQIELQKADASRDIPPILPSPVRPPADRTIHQHHHH